MSRIHRVRVVNVGHEDAYYSDLTLDFEGEDTLLCLANGGGKTTLLHHILQVVKPGARIDRRKIADYFGSRRRTVHVVVEFLLDEKAQASFLDDPPLLLAGVSLENSGPEGDLDRLSYLCEYPRSLVERTEVRRLVREGDPPTVASLPLVVGTDGERRVTTLRDLRQALREGGQVSLYRRDQDREYKNQLASYHIEEETWEGMVRINRVEGGLKHYFERVDTVEKLVREHLLPAVLDPSEEANLREAARQIALSTAELPRLEAEIRLCDAYLDHFGRLRHESGRHREAGAEAEGIRRDAAGTAIRLLATARKAEEAVRSAAAALEAARTERLRAEAERGAFGVLRAERDAEMRAREEWEAGEARKGAEESLAGARRRKTGVEALDLAVRLRKKEAQIEGLRERRRLAALDAEGVEAVWRRAAGEARWAAQELRAEIESRRTAAGQREAEVSSEIARVEEELGATSAEVARLQEALGRLRGWLGLADEEEARVAPLLGELGPEEAVSEVSRQAAELEAEAVAADEARRAELAAARSARGEARTAGEEAERARGRRAGLAEKIASFEDASRALAPVLSRWGCDPQLPHQERRSLLDALEAADRDREERLLVAQGERARRAREATFAEEEGEPLPSDDLLRVWDTLEKTGIAVFTGSRWLLSAPPEAGARALARWPFLPHALVADTGAAWRALCERGAEALAAVELRSPVALLSLPALDEATREEEATAFDPSSGGLVTLGKGVVVPLPSASAPFWNREAFEHLRATAGAAARESAEAARRAREAWENARTDLEAARAFYTRYPEEELARLRQEEASAAREVESLYRKAQVLEGEAADRERNAEALEARASDCRLEAARRAEEARRVADFVERFGRRRSSAQAELRTGEGRLQLLARGGADLEETRRRLSAESGELARATERLGAELRRLEADSEFLGSTEPLAPAGGADYQTLMARAREARDALRSKASNVEAEERALAEADRDIRELRAAIARLGVPEPAPAEVARAAPLWNLDAALEPVEREIRQAEGRLRDAELSLEKASASAREAENALSRARGVFEGAHGAADASFRRAEWAELCREEEKAEDRRLTMAVARAAKAEGRSGELMEEAEAFLGRAAEAAAWARAAAGRLETDPEEEAEPLPPDRVDPARKRLEEALAALDGAEARLREAARLRERRLAEFLEFLRSEATRLSGRLHLSAEAAEQALSDHRGVEHFYAEHASAVGAIRESVVREKDRLETEKTEVAGRALQFARDLAEEIRSIQRYSTVRFAGGTSRRLLEVDLAPRDETTATADMQAFVQRFVEAYAAAPDSDREGLARRSITGFELLKVLCRLERAKVRVYKPKGPGAPARYSPWEEVSSWSGGEKQVACYLLFVATLTYSTFRAAGREDSTKVLLLDNPVGEASSAHLLRVMVELARENQIQLIVFTAHQDPGIWKYFRNLVSLVPVPTSRRTYVQLDREAAVAFKARFSLEEASLFTAPNRDWEEDFRAEE